MTAVEPLQVDHPRVDILGCPFDAVDMDEAEEFIRRTIIADQQAHITVGNVDMVMKARRDPHFAKVFWDSQLTIVDGMPIMWAATFLNRPLKERVAGIELVLRCAAVSHEMHCGVAMVGARVGIAEQAAENMRQMFPHSILHTIRTPYPLRPKDSQSIVKRIRASGDRIVLVALGAPQQEFWVRDHLAATGANVGIGVGAAFDIISGRKPRAPAWMQRCGLEWLHRLKLEPVRLGRRYLIDDMPFVAVLLKEVLRKAVTGHEQRKVKRESIVN
jgi:N-acetylglucosaminyldiphosphoundecaprenol N-acetyl-beta-D-mannosaminyltransferase